MTKSSYLPVKNGNFKIPRISNILLKEYKSGCALPELLPVGADCAAAVNAGGICGVNVGMVIRGRDDGGGET